MVTRPDDLSAGKILSGWWWDGLVAGFPLLIGNLNQHSPLNFQLLLLTASAFQLPPFQLSRDQIQLTCGLPGN